MVNTTNDAHDHMSAEFATIERETQNEQTQMNDFFDRIDHAEAQGNSRAADVIGMKSTTEEFSFTKPAKFNLKVNDQSTGSEFPVLSEGELSTLFCIATAAPLTVWNYLKDFFNDDHCVDAEVNEQEKIIFGNFYKTPQTCSFSAIVAQKKDSTNSSYVDVRRLQGDAFLLNDFFKEVQKHFASKGVTQVEEEAFDIYEMDDDDYEDLFMSEDEEDGTSGGFDGGDFKLEIPQLDPFSTLMEFEHDKSMLHMMVNDFKDTHMEEKNYYMSMLSHNAVRPENRDLMLTEDMDVQMKDLIETQLQEPNSNASLIRDTCLLLKNLACEMKIDEKTIEAACKAMGRWCPGQDAGRKIGELQGSRQSMIELSEFFMKVVDQNIYSEKELLEMVRTKLSADEIIRIGEFISSRSEDSLAIFEGLKYESN